MMKTIGALLAGIVTAFIAVWLVELVGHQFYPLPSDISSGNSEQMAALVRNMPLGAHLFVVAAWILGAFAGGLVAAKISERFSMAWAIAAIVVVAAVLNIMMIPHPEWMQVSAVVAPMIGGLLASHFAKRRLARGGGVVNAAL